MNISFNTLLRLNVCYLGSVSHFKSKVSRYQTLESMRIFLLAKIKGAVKLNEMKRAINAFKEIRIILYKFVR